MVWSLGGGGGGTLAPKARGKIPWGGLLDVLGRSGVAAGMDRDGARDAGEWLGAKLGHGGPGMVMKAGGFPQPQAA